MFRWTNAIVGSQDPEYQQGETPENSAGKARRALFEYFWKMVEERRARPTHDIVSILANAKLRGKEVPPFELLSYYFLLVIAASSRLPPPRLRPSLSTIRHLSLSIAVWMA